MPPSTCFRSYIKSTCNSTDHIYFSLFQIFLSIIFFHTATCIIEVNDFIIWQFFFCFKPIMNRTNCEWSIIQFTSHSARKGRLKPGKKPLYTCVVKLRKAHGQNIIWSLFKFSKKKSVDILNKLILCSEQFFANNFIIEKFNIVFVAKS